MRGAVCCPPDSRVRALSLKAPYLLSEGPNIGALWSSQLAKRGHQRIVSVIDKGLMRRNCMKAVVNRTLYELDVLW